DAQSPGERFGGLLGNARLVTLRAAAESTNAFAFILLRRRGINAGRAGSGESKKSAAACNMLTERAAPRALSRERRRCSAWPLRWRRTALSRRVRLAVQPVAE